MPGAKTPTFGLYSILGAQGEAGSSPRSSANPGLGSWPVQMTRSPGTHEAQQALRTREAGLGSAGLNTPTGAAGRTATEIEARAWSQAWLSRGSL